VLQGEVHSPKTVKRRVKGVRERLRDKSFKEDYTMRLYEFTNPTNYLLAEADAANLLNQSKNIKAADTTKIADRHLRKKPDTKKPTDTL
jgi:hypothetical protein